MFEYTNQTYLHPMAAVVLVVLAGAMLLLPRRWAAAPMVVIAVFVSSAQRVAVFTLDFDLLRLMILAGWLRVLARGETRGMVWKPIDLVMLLWAGSAITMFTLLHGSMEALVNRLGVASEALGGYFLFRTLIRGWDDVLCFAKVCLVVSIPAAAAFTVEYLTRYNFFSIFGRVPEITEMRQGKLRCQGAFPHPIIAGCFWTALLPLIVGLWWSGRAPRWLVATAAGCVLWIVFTTTSSTPIGSVLAAVVGAGFFALRWNMQAVRWSLLGLAVALHFIMQGPLWSIFAKLNFVSGSTGYHRYNLIDKAIHNVGDWWLMGTRSTAGWGYWLHDVTNQFVLEGVRGGMLTLLLFTWVLVLAYSGVGRLMRQVRGNRGAEAMAWALGLALLVHTVNFFGVSYFGQINVVWYALLAIIASMTPVALPKPAAAPAPQGRRFRMATVQEQT